MDPTRERKAAAPTESLPQVIQADEALLPQQNQQELSALVAEMRALYAEMHAPRGLSLWLSKWVKSIETDPKVQAAIHRWSSYWWLLNFPVVAILFFGTPHIWMTVGLLMNTFYSLYANFATDYGAWSAAQASLHAMEAVKTAADSNKEKS
jgi:hypothetical protein